MSYDLRPLKSAACLQWIASREVGSVAFESRVIEMPVPAGNRNRPLGSKVCPRRSQRQLRM